MTTEERQLLLKDLCARLPYCVIMGNKTLVNTHYVLRGADIDEAEFDNEFDDIPYLRPMSSMTEEEEIIYEQLIKDVHYKPRVSTCFKLISWLKEHHFDDNYLIPKGLALEAPKDMYKED